MTLDIDFVQQLVQQMSISSGGQSLAPSLHRWLISGAHIGGEWSADPLLVYFPLGKWLGLLVFLITGAVSLYGTWNYRSKNWSIIQLLVVVHLFVQPGWVHYFCFLPVAQLFFWNRTDRLGRSFVLSAVMLERVPIWWLSNEVYFAFVRSGGLTVVLLLLWAASLCSEIKDADEKSE